MIKKEIFILSSKDKKNENKWLTSKKLKNLDKFIYQYLK